MRVVGFRKQGGEGPGRANGAPIPHHEEADMRIPGRLTAATAALTLGLASAALASGPGTHGNSQNAPGHNRSQQTTTTGTTTGTSSTPSPTNNGKAYGRLC